jgi:hypothetical protein
VAIENYKTLSCIAADQCVEQCIEQDENVPWLWEEKYATLIVEACIETGRRTCGIVWQDLVKAADIEHNMKRALGLVGPKILRNL